MLNNQVKLIGTVSSNFTYDHSVREDDFYKFYLSIERKSGFIDVIPVIVSSKIFNITEDITESAVEIRGSFKSFNENSLNGRKVILYVFAKSIKFTVECDYNEVILYGYLCRKPVYRETPLGRQLTDTCIAVNRFVGKSDYLPAIFWGNNAIDVGGYATGTHIKIIGRLQSRAYNKYVDDIKETRIAYEVSAKDVEVIIEQI